MSRRPLKPGWYRATVNMSGTTMRAGDEEWIDPSSAWYLPGLIRARYLVWVRA